MNAPDISRHAPALHRLAEERGLPAARVADRFIEHGLEHPDLVLDWSPGQPRQNAAAPLTGGAGDRTG